MLKYKKTFTKLLCLVLFITVSFHGNIFGQGIMKAEKLLFNNDKNIDEKTMAFPITSYVFVNGEETSFDAYIIKENNYFKLRDLAQVFKGSKKQFDVIWDNEKKAINLISGKSYNSTGGEFMKSDYIEKPAILNSSIIYRDGKEIELTAFTINGNNYFKLRDIGEAFDIYIGWNGKTNTVTIDTSFGYGEDEQVALAEALRFEEEVIRLVNIERQKENLAPYIGDRRISDVARIKSADMGKNDYFDHISPNLGTPFELMDKHGIEFMFGDENIAMGHKTAESVVTGWMNSPPHRASIMNATTFKKIGVGFYRSEDGICYWTQMFTN